MKGSEAEVVENVASQVHNKVNWGALILSHHHRVVITHNMHVSTVE